jgi:hypothetical protein
MPIRPELRHFYSRPEWRELSRHIRKERAQDRCECIGQCGTYHFAQNAERQMPRGVEWRCSAFEGQPHPVTRSKVVLTVAHLDHTPGNDDPENLRAFCQRCHNSYDQRHRKQNAHQTRRAKKAIGDLLEESDD